MLILLKGGQKYYTHGQSIGLYHGSHFGNLCWLTWLSIIFLSSLQKINTYPSDIPKIKGCSRCIWNSHSQTHTKVYQSKTVDLTPGLGDFILFEDYFTVEIIMIHSDQCPVDRATCEVWSHISSVITTTLINHPDP